MSTNNRRFRKGLNPFDRSAGQEKQQQLCAGHEGRSGINPSDPPRSASPTRVQVGKSSSSYNYASPQKGGTPSVASSGSHRSSNIDTNMLLQSAARSVLDGKSPPASSSTPVSEDEFASKAALRSLEKKPLPAMPDEQDRKRFIGCLAAVLASSYDYDVMDECDDMMEAAREERMAYLDAVDDDSQYVEIPEKIPKKESAEDETTPVLSGDSFDYPESDATFDTMMSPTTSITRAPAPRRIGTGDKTSKELQKIRLSRARHRKRRYNVLSKFLLDCAVYLRLEKGQARAFLPMLTKLLVPRQPPEKSKLPLSEKLKRIPIKLKKSLSTGIARSDISGSGDDTGGVIDEQMLTKISEAAVDDFSSRASDIYNQEVDEIEHLRPFLESMSTGGGFRCLSMVMLQYLLYSKDGYDARVRNAMKRIGVLLLVHEMENDPSQVEAEQCQNGEHPDLVTLATRRFESLEHEIALRILKLSRNQQPPVPHDNNKRGAGGGALKSQQGVQDNGLPKGITRQQLMRGLKVAGVGAAAATLFAVTGGLAAPGIAAGVAALAGGTAATAAVAAVLTSTAAVTTIFGVGGGTLVAYKMNRRTQGVTEFQFRKETGNNVGGEEHGVEAELFSTISMSGWLRDFCDFQRPWGISPSNPWISDQVELLERFYAVHRPENVIKAARIIESWEGEEKELWNLLRQKYGNDPDHLYPLADGPRQAGSLTLEQKEVVDQMLVEMELVPKPTTGGKGLGDRIRGRWGKKSHDNRDEEETSPSKKSPEKDHKKPLKFDSFHDGQRYPSPRGSAAGVSTVSSTGFESISISVPLDADEDEQEEPEVPKHIATVWDYRSNYGGELYTIRWESELLKELCDSVADLAFDLVSGGTAQILKHTALSALMSAVAWPYALVSAANMIDGTWTLAVERSDEAGRELARSLLFSRAGHRPVTLLGFSFGARAIYSCLKELAKYQEKWCEYQEKLAANPELEKQGEDDEEDSFRNMREPASIVEDAVLMGLPNHMSLPSWRACRQVVAGRLVNCFSQKDLILSLMFQFKRLKLKPVCGTCPVAVSGVENIDVADLVSGHEQYCIVTGDLLKKVRHGQPFRSRPARIFEPENFEAKPEGKAPRDSEKFDV